MMMRVLVLVLLSATGVFSQNKDRKVHWPSTIINYPNSPAVGYSDELSRVEALEIVDIAVAGKSITMGQKFAGDDEWLKNLTVRVKNISNLSIAIIQLNLFLPEVMPGGPMVTLCYGCGGVGNKDGIMPGKEVELKLVFYEFVTKQINAKSSLSMITSAEIQHIIITLTDGRKWLTSCLKTLNPKNACPTSAP